MKKNDYLLLIAAGAYSFLFYRQTAGINYLLFTLIFIAVLVLKNTKLLHSKKWLWSALLCLVSAVSVVVHSSDLSILANIFSLLLLSAFSVNVVTSSLFSFLFSCYSILSSLIYIVLDSVQRWQGSGEKPAGKSGIKVLVTFLALLLSILFFSMYKSSNPLFAENTKWLNFDFISAAWIIFTLGGFLLAYGLFYCRTVSVVERWENQIPLANTMAGLDEEQEKRYETERYGGLLLFILLNLMLVILNAGDIQTLYFNGGLPAHISHSDFVHHGVGILILSILIATGLIMYLSRREFDGVKNNKVLMVFIYLWIFQNIVMLSSTAFRNQIYIHDYNFTYKRIGVYVWLLLAMCGLCIMFWKIYKKRTNWYLIRTNVALWFSVLVISGCFNWDKLITDYNLHNKALANVDFYYLFSLSEANLPELIAVTKKPAFSKLNSQLRDYTASALTAYHAETYTGLLNEKIYAYLSNYKSGWRSFDLRNKEILESIY